MCSCRSLGVAWVFAIVLDVEIFQVHEIIGKCKNHYPPAGGGAPRRSAGASRPAITEFCYYKFLSAGRKAIAYTDLLATVFYSDNPRIVFISCLPTIAIISTTSLFIL